MTIEFIIVVVLFGSALIALDYLLLRAQSEPNSLPLINSLRIQWDRLANWAADSLRQKPERPTDGSNAVEQDISWQTEAAPGQAKTPEEASGLESIPAGKTARVHIEAEIPPNTVLHITISTNQEGQAHIEQKRFAAFRPPRKLSISSLRPAILGFFTIPAERLAVRLFVLALLTYLLTRLIGLTDFPIYFFGDEAIQTSTASDLMQRGMRGPDGTFLPTYFQNGQYFNLSVSVYLQTLPQLLFGKSIFVTRATSVMVTLLAAVSVGLLLRNFFKVKRWWLGTLFLSIAPAWFLHSRTAFETVLFVSFYAAFLYFYLAYRMSNPKRVYWAVIFAGLAFYSYSPGQLVLALTGLFLFFSDLKYHWQQRSTLLPAIGMVAILALPYLRFRLTADYSPLDHLRSLGSYWIQPLPLSQKWLTFFSEYLRGLSPTYWFFDSPDMARHQMRDYGHLSLWFAPFLLVGIALSLWRWRSPAHRLVLLAALAAPSGAALAEIGITRVLVFVIPASLLAAIGLDWLLSTLESFRIPHSSFIIQNSSFSYNFLSLLTFTPLVLINFAMLSDALRNGPTWYTDYGLYGMQYGAKQIYQQTVVPTLQQDPQARFIISPSWANGAENFVSFFVPDALRSRVSLGQIYDFLNPPRPFTEKDYFVVTSLEFEKISSDPKFKNVVVRSTIPYPNGEIGFYILNIELQENIQDILAAEDLARRTPVEETIEWMGQTVRVRHSHLGGGRLQDVIDGDSFSLARGERDNPILYEFFFSRPITASELVLTTGSMRNFDVVVRVYAVGEETPVEYSSKFIDLPDDPTVILPFVNGPTRFDRISISIRDNNQGGTAQVHVREIAFR